MSNKIKLYGYIRSSTSYRVRILIGIKNIDIETISVDLIKDGGQQRQEAFLKLNPQGLVPVLILDNGQILTQSPAILEYLDEAYPSNKLLPDNIIDKAKVRALTNLIACDIHPLD
ncbi:MAG: glutathione S-transferase N-terminal domain-containing protein, partial [Rhizobiales bacterium]|nr:glutathione S-transferase N-terminal domain-containing protein [Hyphomicrobiales bacterium]